MIQLPFFIGWYFIHFLFFFFQAEDGIRDTSVTGVQTCALPISVIGAIHRGGARFSVTVPANASIRAAIAAIGDDAWTPIRYPRAIWDDQLGGWIDRKSVV